MQNRKSVRDVIVDAMDEAKVVKRSQPIPGHLFETALNLLKNRLAEYSNCNYLQFLRKAVTFTVEQNETVLGDWLLKDGYDNVVTLYELESDIPSEGNDGDLIFCRANATGYIYENDTWTETDTSEWFENVPDVYAPDLQTITKVYYSTGNDHWEELHFVSFEDFDSFDPLQHVYTIIPEGINYQRIITRDLKGYQLKVIYNREYDINKDTVFNIPGQYIALFTAALVVDLNSAFPRMSGSTAAAAAQRLATLEQNVRSTSSVNKFIGRDTKPVALTYESFANGTWW